MRIDIFGKQECSMCAEAKKIVTNAVSEKAVTMVYHDMETVDGLAEGAFFNVADIPTIIISKGPDVDEFEPLARWNGQVPVYQDVLDAISGNYTGKVSFVKARACTGTQCTL